MALVQVEFLPFTRAIYFSKRPPMAGPLFLGDSPPHSNLPKAQLEVTRGERESDTQPSVHHPRFSSKVLALSWGNSGEGASKGEGDRGRGVANPVGVDPKCGTVFPPNPGIGLDLNGGVAWGDPFGKGTPEGKPQ